MVDWIIGIIAFIIVLSVIVLLHEGGHFFFAHKAGILCFEYSLGMGPQIWKKKKGETMLSIRAIPIGGYVSMAGEEVEEDPLNKLEKCRLELDANNRVSKIITDLDNPKYLHLPEYDLIDHDIYGTKECGKDELFVTVSRHVDESIHEDVETFIVNRDCMILYLKNQEQQIAPYDRTFVNKSWGQRFMTVFGGPLMNFVLAWILFIILGIFQGYANTSSTIIGDTSNSLFQTGDKIVTIGDYELSKWDDVSEVMNKYATGEEVLGSTITVVVIRDNNEVTLEVKPQVVFNCLELVLETNVDIPTVALYNDEDTMEETIAGKAGIEVGDIIVGVKATKDEEKTIINSKYDLLKYFGNYERENIDSEDVTLYVKRGEEELEFNLQSHSEELLAANSINLTKVQMGVSCEYSFDFVKLLYEPIVNTGESCLLIFKTIKVLFTDKSVGVKNLSGPIGILKIIKTSAESGILNVIYWAAIISVNIGFMNILPLPALDGGRIAFLLYEGITKKKPSPKVENIIHTVGFVLLMILTVYIAFNDILRLF